MKKEYQQPWACVEAVCLGDAITIPVSRGEETDDALVKGGFGHRDEAEEDRNDWSDIW